MSDDNYEAMFSQYQREQQSLKPLVEELSYKLKEMGEIRDNKQKWIDLIAKYADLQEIDAPIVNELCEKILIHEYEKVDGNRIQKIEIFYCFVGKLPTIDGEDEHQILGKRHYCTNNAIKATA